MNRIQRLIPFELKPIRIKKGNQELSKLVGKLGMEKKTGSLLSSSLPLNFSLFTQFVL